MNSSFGDESQIDESNPFSFKNFQIPDIPSFDLPDVKTNEKSSSQPNPFSFNKFVPNEPALEFSLPDLSPSVNMTESDLPEIDNPSIDEIPTEFELYDHHHLPLVNKNEESLKEELKQSQETIVKQQNKKIKLEKRLRALEKKEENEAKT